MAMGGQQDDRRPMADINVTPLVDVMLVLLVIFMVTAPLVTGKPEEPLNTMPVGLPTVPPAAGGIVTTSDCGTPLPS